MAHQPNISLRTFPVALDLHRWLGGLALVFAGMLAGMEISLCVRSLSNWARRRDHKVSTDSMAISRAQWSTARPWK